MSFFKKQLPLLIILCLLCACKAKNIRHNEAFHFSKKPGNIYFTILQINDVYEIAPIQANKFGGMARVETIHQELLKENPNTMLVLAGDFLNPSLLGTMKFEGERVRGKQMVEVMNAMNFELVAFGNHEFDLSYSNLQDRLNESDFEWISSNVFHNRGGENHFFHKVINGKKEVVNETYTKEFTVNGKTLKLGFISVCIPSNPKSYVSYSDMYVEAERTFKELQPKVDFVLGLTHVKVAQDREIAKLLPEIPLIMGGHEHTNKYEKVGKTVITKADANVKTVYIHRFQYNPNTDKLEFKSELKTIDEKIPSDPKVGSIVAKWQNLLRTKIKDIIDKPDEIVYKTKIALDARDTPIRSVQTNMGGIIAKAMSFAYNDTIDAAFVNGGSIRIDDKLKGNITATDIFRVLPYGGKVIKVKMKGSLLKKVLDFGEKASGTGAYLQRFNLKKTDTGEWMIKNSAIEKESIYTIATSDYLLKGYDIPFLNEKNKDILNVYSPSKNELSSDIRKSVIQFFKAKK